jgi:cytosine/adenosine deaminase-related metal-dependent hydrolase
VAHTAPVVLPVCAAPIRDGAVVVSDGVVASVGPARQVPDSLPRREWSGVLTPGLVNAHAHLQYTHFADLESLTVDFVDWLIGMRDRRAAVDDDGWAASTTDGVDLLLRTGTTCVADVVSDAAALAPVAAAGLAGVSYLEAVGADARRWADDRRERLLAGLAGAPVGRAVGVSPHALYTLSAEVFRDCVDIARSRALRLHTHLAESAAEHEYVQAGTGRIAAVCAELGLDPGGLGCTPTALLDRLGGLGPDCHVAHGVHVDAADRALLRARGTSVALCVRSNRALGAGEPPVAAYLAEDVPLAVGTDSLASAPSLDLLAELAAARDLAVRQGAPLAGLDQRLFHAATAGGAAAMGLTDVGVLRPGARADLAVFDVDSDDPYPSLVTGGAGRCIGTVLAGAVVFEPTAA